MNTLTATQLADWLKSQSLLVLDVREDWEYQTCHLPGSLHIPMGEVPNRLNEIDDQVPVVCLCHHGVRSYHVALYLQKQGFENVYNLHGGIHAWSADVDAQCPTY